MSNLADKQSVNEAEQIADLERKQELNDIRALLSNAAGRRFVWRMLGECKTFGSVYDSDSSQMSYLSGKQDLGHFIVAEIVNADENLLFKLMKENKKGDI